MPTAKVIKNRNYTTMSNFHLRDKNLSLKAIGLLSYILSLPDDWDYSIKGLAANVRDGKQAVQTALKELEQYGYLVRVTEREENGQIIDVVYYFYEEPQTVEPMQETVENEALEKPHPSYRDVEKPYVEKPHPDNQDTDNQDTDNRDTDNRSQLNTNITNILNIQNTKSTNTCFLTSRAREDEASVNFQTSIETQIGRKLVDPEKAICLQWCQNETDFQMIDLAVKDNLFRGDKFNLKYVQDTLNDWKSKGITDAIKARNYILDRHVENLSALAVEIADRNDDSEIANSIIKKNPAANLKATRDFIVEEYKAGNYGRMMFILQGPDLPLDELCKLLPEEIVEYITKQRMADIRLASM